MATRNGDSKRVAIPEKDLAWLSKEHIETSQQKSLYLYSEAVQREDAFVTRIGMESQSLKSLEGGV